jgi:hypothetical protein
MTQEQKDILLKDLCARLPYGVKCIEKTPIEDFQDKNLWEIDRIRSDTNMFGMSNCYVCYGQYEDIHNIKPYLFPLSSMTDELWDKEFMGYGITEFTRDSFKYGCETLEFNNDNPHLSSMVRFINQLIKNHFDIYGLIPMGLAEDATGLDIY